MIAFSVFFPQVSARKGRGTNPALCDLKPHSSGRWNSADHQPSVCRGENESHPQHVHHHIPLHLLFRPHFALHRGSRSCDSCVLRLIRDCAHPPASSSFCRSGFHVTLFGCDVAAASLNRGLRSRCLAEHSPFTSLRAPAARFFLRVQPKSATKRCVIQH